MALNERQLRFVAEFVADPNATKAALRAGYASASAYQQAHQLLKNSEIDRAIVQARVDRLAKIEFGAEQVLREWITIATANPAELVRYITRGCRHCNGAEHAYQWRSVDEWSAAVVETQQRNEARQDEPGYRPADLPDCAGGFGYANDLEPVATCPKCLGAGETETRITDTRNWSPGAAKLFAGLKQTKDGIEVKLRDQEAALANLARCFGMFIDKKQLTGPGGGPIEIAEIRRTVVDPKK